MTDESFLFSFARNPSPSFSHFHPSPPLPVGQIDSSRGWWPYLSSFHEHRFPRASSPDPFPFSAAVSREAGNEPPLCAVVVIFFRDIGRSSPYPVLCGFFFSAREAFPLESFFSSRAVRSILEMYYGHPSAVHFNSFPY